MPALKPYIQEPWKTRIAALAARTFIRGCIFMTWIILKASRWSGTGLFGAVNAGLATRHRGESHYSNTDPAKDQMEKYNDNGTVVTAVPFGDLEWIRHCKPIFVGSNNRRATNRKGGGQGLQIHRDQNIVWKNANVYQTILVTQDDPRRCNSDVQHTNAVQKICPFGNYRGMVRQITWSGDVEISQR